MRTERRSPIAKDLKDGESAEVKGSAAKPYTIKNVGGVYSCSCPAWRNQSLPIERRTCKHLRQYRGEQAEQQRLGGLPQEPAAKASKPTAPALLLAQTWNNTDDLTGWWLSEKLDGVRAYWTGSEFRSRGGNTFHAPDWFTQGLPDIPLDGELWLARKSFQRTVSIVRRQDQPASWNKLEYVVFDAPQVESEFENRIATVQQLFAERTPEFARVLSQHYCRDTWHLIDELNRILSVDGEGVMLRMPGSLYEPGRSNTLLKVKKFQETSAVVVGHQPGKGRHKGRLGAVLVELADRTRFAVGSGFTDRERNNPPPIGSTIEFTYQELTDGRIPRFPVFLRMRPDLAITNA